MTVPASSKLAAYLEKDRSLEALQSKIIIPRVKLIQGTTKGDLKKQFGAGSAILAQGQVLLAKLDESFFFNPYFYWEEWTKMKDLNDPDETTPMFLERSYSQDSPIAKKAASKEHRWEVYPGQEKVAEDKKLYYRYVHHFNFAGEIYSEGEAFQQQVALSFEKGEWSTGRRFCSDAATRKIGVTQEDGSVKYVPLPLWAQVWAFTPVQREFGTKQWYGYKVETPPEDLRRIRDEDFDRCRQKHEELFAAHEKKLLAIEGENEAEGDEKPEGSGEM